jgi:hypothetical protein
MFAYEFMRKQLFVSVFRCWAFRGAQSGLVQELVPVLVGEHARG